MTNLPKVKAAADDLYHLGLLRSGFNSSQYKKGFKPLTLDPISYGCSIEVTLHHNYALLGSGIYEIISIFHVLSNRSKLLTVISIVSFSAAFYLSLVTLAR